MVAPALSFQPGLASTRALYQFLRMPTSFLPFVQRITVALCIFGAAARANAQSLAPGDPADPSRVIQRVVGDACHKSVVLLGEPSTHAFGSTMAFKAALVRRLVDECHFDALFFESGTYDFVEIARRLKSGESVTDSMVGAAIGGIWANRDVSPLIPFLVERMRRGQLTLGGLDDQLGRGTWAQRGMPAALVPGLSPADSAGCLAVLNRHMFYQYTDSAPFNQAAKGRILQCLDTIGRGGSANAQLLENLRRTLARDYGEGAAASDPDLLFNARDHSMFLNFQWWWSQLPPRSKVIVWTATVHAAKSLRDVPGLERRISMGSLLRQAYGDRTFALAFSAAGGSSRFAHQPEQPLAPAPDSTLEGRAFSAQAPDITYMNRTQLRRLAVIAARPFGGDFKATDWSQIVDGLVIFRAERPPLT